MSSLRRSARARLPAGDGEGGMSPPTDKRKRKRSTMTPEASQSPAKGSSPMSDSAPNHNHEQSTSAGLSTSPGAASRPSTRKIVVKNPRRSQTDVNATSQASMVNSNGVAAQHAEESGGEDGLQELYLDEEERAKLETVLQVYAPELLGQKSASLRQDGSQPTTTIKKLLSQPRCSIRDVRKHVLAIRAPLISPAALRPHLSSSYISPPTEDSDRDRRKLSMLTMLLAIVEEIGFRARSRVKLEDGEEAEDGRGLEGKRQDAQDYAMYMRLPSGDYFTNAVRLSSKEALELDTGNSKLVDIAVQPVTLDSRPAPTLSERLAKRKKPVAAPLEPLPEKEDSVRPVSHLYYSPWSSFAPTYDSFDGNLSFRASCNLWRAKTQDRRTLEALAVEPLSKREEFEEALYSLDDVDADAIMDHYDELREAPDLNKSGALLRKLDDLQMERWARVFARRSLNQSTLPDDPSEEEREVAGQVVDTLTQLLAQHSGSLSGILPPASVLRAAATSACLDPALVDGKGGEPGYWGSLNDSLYGPTATRRVTGARSQPVRPMAALRDNETIKMEPASEEKVPAQVGTATKGKGLLDRFADARQYTLEDHPHDRKLVVPGTNQQPFPPPGSTPQQPHAHPHQQQQGRPPQGNAAAQPKQPGQYMSPPANTPPARPFYPGGMRPMASPNYAQQKQGGGYFYNPGQQSPSLAQSNSNQRSWAQTPQSQALQATRSYVGGSPS